MTGHIIETIGKWGVKTTPAEHARYKSPQPGDVIDFGVFQGEYPFNYKYGRIDSRTRDKGRISVCCGGASVFLNEDGSVNISGGPFHSVNLEDLEPAFELKTVRFWNWGDNGPGGGHGVDYYIPRPIFRLASRPC